MGTERANHVLALDRDTAVRADAGQAHIVSALAMREMRGEAFALVLAPGFALGAQRINDGVERASHVGEAVFVP
jgi:hypothetical protein